MCYICLRDNPVVSADRFGKENTTKGVTETQAKAIYIKAALKYFTNSDEPRCHIGDAMLEQLKQEQYKIAQQM